MLIGWAQKYGKNKTFICCLLQFLLLFAFAFIGALFALFSSLPTNGRNSLLPNKLGRMYEAHIHVTYMIILNVFGLCCTIQDVCDSNVCYNSWRIVLFCILIWGHVLQTLKYKVIFVSYLQAQCWFYCFTAEVHPIWYLDDVDNVRWSNNYNT